MSRAGRVRLQRGLVEAGEDAEHLADGYPAGTRRRRQEDGVAAIFAGHRRSLLDGIVREVGEGQQAAVRLRSGHDVFGNRSAIEGRFASSGDQTQRLGQIGLDEPVADRVGPARFEEHGGRGRIDAEVGGVLSEDGDILRFQQEAVAGQRDRRRDEPGARQAPIAAAGIFQTGDRSGCADAEIAIHALLGVDLAVRRQIHVGRGGDRRPLTEIDEGVASGFAVPRGDVDHHEPTAADVAATRMDDRQGVADGHGGIDGVAAVTKHHRAGLGRVMLRRDHHASVRKRRLHRRGLSPRRSERDGENRDTCPTPRRKNPHVGQFARFCRIKKHRCVCGASVLHIGYKSTACRQSKLNRLSNHFELLHRTKIRIR